MFYKKSIGDKIFDFVVYALVTCTVLVTLYPLIYVFSMSISDPHAASAGKVWFLPIGFDLTSMKKILADPSLPLYYYNTIWYTLIGTVATIIVTCLMAYPLSRKEFKLSGFFNRFVMITMFFHGGIIPTYLVVARNLNLYNNRWVVVITALTSAWYIMITKSFFASLPDELIESANLDGAGNFRIFGQIVIPLSKPILAVLALYQSVAHWNSYFTQMLYITKKEYHPLSLYVRKLVLQSQMNEIMGDEAVSAEDMLALTQIKYGVIVVSVLPMMIIYPFISKYLEKGLMVGAVKG